MEYAAMIDSLTQERIVVSTDGTTGPYIMVPLQQLDSIEAVLRGSQIAYWVDADAISLDGKPEIAVINLGRGASADQIQRLLDNAN
jgi:hypothetical protein